MTIILRRTDIGDPIGFVELLTLLSWKPNKHGLLGSMKTLYNHGMVTKEYRKFPKLVNPFVYYIATPKAYIRFRGSSLKL